MRKMTRKDINHLKDMGFNIYHIAYCEAQNLLKPYERIGYNTGVYGWNWSVYRIGNNIIVTGYRHFPSCTQELTNLAAYEKRAHEAMRGFSTPYEARTRLISTLWEELFHENQAK